MIVTIGGVEYESMSVLDSNLSEYQKIENIISQQDKEFVDKEIEVLAILTDIPVEVLDIIDLEQAHRLFLTLTDIKVADIEVVNSLDIEGVNYTTSAYFNEYSSISVNRSQHKIIKKSFIEDPQNKFGVIMAAFFTEDGSAVVKGDEDFYTRSAKMQDTVKLRVAIPFITKVIELTAIQSQNTLSMLNDNEDVQL